MRRFMTVLSLLIVVLIGAVFMTRGGTTVAQEEATGDAAALVGTWRCVVTRSDGATFSSVTSYGSDGTVVAVGSPAQPAPPNAPPGLVIISTGVGTWQSTGPDTAVMTFVHYQANGEGQFIGTITPQAVITIGADGQSYLAETVTTIAAPDGSVLSTVTGISECTRMVAEAPAIASPEA